MNVVVERFIELAVIQHYRPLTAAEMKEFRESYLYLVNRQWKMAQLKNFSLMAYQAGDVEWHHEICAELDRIERR
ncbi:DUF7667 family protein [Thermicanus aegyptius]|uniref:DUF7667 family protein n=1 Tax=Thermicanus aegyptius TaxID=94009 RepID=UPI0003FE7AF4|nr:hypothetical protein [Thermicanus aegyptius]